MFHNMLTFARNLLLQMVNDYGLSERSNAAVNLQEEVTVAYGPNSEFVKVFEVRRVMFHHGSSSAAGHYTVAARQQRGGHCQPGDLWHYFDSASPPVTRTLETLTASYSRDVVGVLLVAKDPPAFANGPCAISTMLRCASFSA